MSATMTAGRTGRAAVLPRRELVASMALATDLAMGHPVEQGLGSCIVATRLAEIVGVSEAELARTAHLALLRHIGCTTENARLAELSGDEIRMAARLAPLSGSSGPSYVRAMLRLATAGRPPIDAARTLTRALAGLRDFDRINQAICEVAQGLATRLGFEPELIDEIQAVYERWDGSGFPNHLRGQQLPISIRISQVADLATVLHDLGHDDPGAVIRERASTGFDPTIAETFAANAAELLAALDVPSRWDAVLALPIADHVTLEGEAITDSLGALADFTDLKSPFLVGHSSGVAELAASGAEATGLPGSDVAAVRAAGLVHDLGRISVSTAIWDKPGPLDAGEWEVVRLHPYHTERLLSRSPFLARIASIAGLHHERSDGSGYPRGVISEGQTQASRLLGAADAYHAMTEPRAHRPAMASAEAAAALQRDVSGGRLDRDAIDAVLAAAGHRPTRRKRYSQDLTARELEVLRLLARGRSNRDIAQALTISPRTAENHTRAIYDKVGVTTRAAATLFAMQHGLMDTVGGELEPAER